VFLKVELDIAAVLLDDSKDLFQLAWISMKRIDRLEKYLQRLGRDLQNTVSAHLQFSLDFFLFIAATYLWPTMVASEHDNVVGSHSDRKIKAGIDRS
jgi:hypothetical protein